MTVAIGAKPNDLLADLRTFGFVFETLAVRDLRVYVDALGGTVRHYLDKTGLKCDAIVSDEDGNYGLVEIKLGGDELIGHGVKTLHAFISLTELRQTLLDNRIIDSLHRMRNLAYSERLRNYRSGVSSILVNACTSSCTNHRNPFTDEI